MKRPCCFIVLMLASLSAFLSPGIGAAASAPPPAPAPTAQPAEAEKWGIQVVALRTSAYGRVIDFRYKVVDADKAAALADPHSKPYLLDQATGAKLLVPRTPKVGPLRQTAQKPDVGRTYFVLFANPAQIVKAGSKVTAVIGDFRAENLVVELAGMAAFLSAPNRACARSLRCLRAMPVRSGRRPRGRRR